MNSTSIYILVASASDYNINKHAQHTAMEATELSKKYRKHD